MRKLISFVFLTFCFCVGHSQISSTESETEMSYSIIRSNLGISGSSHTFTANTKQYIVSQSIGQASVIGTSSNSGYTLRQGYQQPSSLTYIIPLDGDNKLKAIIYPNPFQQSISISFSELILNDIEVLLFDIKGSLIYSGKFIGSPLIRISLSDIANGYYVIKVSSGNKQISAKLIKR